MHPLRHRLAALLHLGRHPSLVQTPKELLQVLPRRLRSLGATDAAATAGDSAVRRAGSGEGRGVPGESALRQVALALDHHLEVARRVPQHLPDDLCNQEQVQIRVQVRAL